MERGSPVVAIGSQDEPPGPATTGQAPKAGDGNRTHVACLEGRYSTIELHPREPRGHPRDIMQSDRFRCVAQAPGPNDLRVAPEWVEQDSNLRRQCHQIYS